MKVGWLVTLPPYTGGAELTQAEFRAAAPEGVEIIDCPAGEVVPGLDRYVLHNVVGYTISDLASMGGTKTIKYVHDLWPEGDADLREAIIDRAELVFCSPLHLEEFDRRWRDAGNNEGHIIPPAIDLDRFKAPRQVKRNTERSGTCSIASWRNPGKGGQALLEWAADNGPVDVYGEGDFIPHGHNLEQKGPLDSSLVAQTLWGYERFAFLPFQPEPFCRAVAEAHAAGCSLTVNRLVGALHWLQDGTDGLQTAGQDFWEVVTS